MQLIIKNGQVVATHADDQDVAGLYPAECQTMLVPDDTKMFNADGSWKTISDLNIVDPWPQIRINRDRLLFESDWTQLPDTPLDATAKTAWATYRQELRDLPQTQTSATSYLDITWPTSPE